MNDISTLSTDSQDQIEEQTQAKPGALLKEAREKLGLSVGEIAKSLYLTRSKLVALEHDEYDKLQSHVFIKGYLRKYAPLVGLNDDQLVELFESVAGEESQSLEGWEVKADDIPNTIVPKLVVPAALFGVAAIVLVTMVVFMGDDGETVANLSPASDIDQELEERVAANAIVEEEPNLDRELAAEAREFAEQAALETQAIEEAVAVESVSQTPPLLAQGNSVAAVGRNANTGTAVNSELRFEFSEDCWLEVRDQFDKIIYTNIAKAGDSLELQGEPPFAISLGNAQAVTLFWDEEEINTQPRPGFRTHKFVLGDEPLTR